MDEFPEFPQPAPFRRSRKRERMSEYEHLRALEFPAENELKHFDTTLSWTMDATGEVPATGQICLVDAGDSKSQRTGRRIHVHSIQIRARLSFDPSTGTVGSTTADMYLILDKQCQGTAAAVGDVFTGGNLSVALTNPDNHDRFEILKRWNFVMHSNAGVSGAYAGVVDQIDYLTLCNIPIIYNNTTGALTEITSNNIFLIAGSTGTDDLITVSGRARLRFTDG